MDLLKALMGRKSTKTLGSRFGTELSANSPNSCWEHSAFRGYADYMMEDAFWFALDSLLAQARLAITAIMCSETLWWRCHRRLIADALMARGVGVQHIMKPGIVVEYVLSPPARIIGDRISYIGAARQEPALNKGLNKEQKKAETPI